jgi:pimeloyl-ACP methyl ester carboxylesterase
MSASLLMFAGMRPSEHIFAAQQAAFPGLRVVPWIPPQRRESLGAYARRLAERLADEKPTYLGGISFGGIIALEVAALLPVRACFLISSVASPCEMPPWMRAARWCVPAGRDWLLRSAGHIAKPWPRSKRSAATARVSKFAGEGGAWYRWATAAVLRWKPNPAIATLKIHRIHGQFDRTFPSRYVGQATMVPSGGHVLPVTHPELITSFLSEGMAECRVSPDLSP